MEIEFKATLEKHLVSGVNLFTGAGFSVLASSKYKDLPVGDDLKNEILEEFKGFPPSLALPQLCTLVSRTQKEDLDNFFRKRFDVDKFDYLYKNLHLIEIKNIFTTNVDNLIQKIFNDSKYKYVNDVNLNGASISHKDAIDYYYLHGSIVDPSSNLIFGDLDIASAFSDEPTRWNYLRKVMSEHPTIFWGYALRDAGTLTTFSNALTDHGLSNAWIVVNPKYEKEGEVDYYKSLGLKIIKADTKEFLAYLGEVAKKNDSHLPIDSINPYPEHNIPDNSSITHRAIQDFFQGATPTWSDIYSPRVIRTQYYDHIINSLDAGKNVLITGEAASGKSTLLMQVASKYSFNGVKLFIKDITKERIISMLIRLADKPALFFIDDCQSSLEALTILSKSKQYRYVVAERDYAYLSSSNHEFFTKDIEVVDVTEINGSDAAKIYESIPQDVKKTPRTRNEENDSIFEFIERNCRLPNLKERFNSVISHLEQIDEKLVDLFLLICYMHRSGSVTSMDILLSYFRDSISGYQEIYSLVETLGASVKQYTGDLVETDQDYFNIRSNMLADLIPLLAPVKSFSRVLSTFHNNVSRYSIPNYDTFKRKAYDAGVFQRVFPDIDDGIKIYDVIYRKHASPFNLQQKALYLSRRKRHDMAFPVIDEAVAKAGSKNWSIKNSYAIIKFKANIDLPDNSDIRKAIDESMELLETCYSSDVRKTFHAMTYAGHALQYWEKYRDDISIMHIEKSGKWLESEISSTRSIHNVKRLLMRCNKILRSYKS